MALCVWRPGFLMKTQFYTRLTEKGYDFEGVRKWEKQEDLLEYGKIIVPINFHDIHWALAIINLRDKLFQYPRPDRLVSTAHTAPDSAPGSTVPINLTQRALFTSARTSAIPESLWS